jgi:hypothetical protein
MNNPELQEGYVGGIGLPMMEKKKDDRKRDRLLVELPEGGRDVWREARITSLRRGISMGTLIVEVLRKELGLTAKLQKH